jgi:hypothetical protein
MMRPAMVFVSSLKSFNPIGRTGLRGGLKGYRAAAASVGKRPIANL